MVTRVGEIQVNPRLSKTRLEALAIVGSLAVQPLLTRRAFIARVAALAAASQLGACASLQPPRFDKNPFTLGVASGDPLPDGVVLWTRLAPDPLHGGGMPPHPVRVEWEVAADEGFRDVV